MSPLELFNHLWQSTVVAVALLALMALCRRLPARTRLTLGWMALLKFFVPIAWIGQAVVALGGSSDGWLHSNQFVIPAAQPAVLAVQPASPGAGLPSVATSLPENALSTADSAGVRFNSDWLVPAIWSTGFAALVLPWLVKGRRLRRKILAEALPITPAMERQIRAASSRIGTRSMPRCVLSPSGHGPALMGIFNPVLIVPQGIEKLLTTHELDAILAHELVHLRRRDSIWSALQVFTVAALWFNPIAWLLGRWVRLETEKSCDEEVIAACERPEIYADGILKVVRHSLGLPQPLLLSAITPPIVSRIRNILGSEHRPNRPLLRTAAIIAGAALALGAGHAGSVAFAAAADAPPPAPPATAVPSAPPPAPPVQPSPPPIAPQQKEDTVTVDFPDREIREIVGSVGDLFRLNVLVPESLQGRATIRLRGVTWRQIYAAVLDPVGYTFVEQGNIIRIVPKPAPATPPPASRPDPNELIGPVRAPNVDLATVVRMVEVMTGRTFLRPLPENAAGRGSFTVSIDGRVPRRQVVEAFTAVLRERGIVVMETGESSLLMTISVPQASPPADSAPVPMAAASQAATSAQVSAVDPGSRYVVPPSVTLAFPPAAKDLFPSPTTVTLEFIVDTLGTVVSAFAISGPKELQPAAVSAVKQWKFTPRVSGERGVGSRYIVEVHFAEPKGEVAAPAAEVQGPPIALLDKTYFGSLETTDLRGQSLEEARILEVADVDRHAVPTFQPPPEYPFDMRRSGVEAKVDVELIVGISGKVIARAVSGRHEFQTAAAQGVSKWRFQPAMKDGVPVNMRTKVEITFTLR